MDLQILLRADAWGHRGRRTVETAKISIIESSGWSWVQLYPNSTGKGEKNIPM